MSSFFSPRAKSQARQCSSVGKSSQIGQLTGDGGNSDSKSMFSKMRKKRPPPINISLECGNIIFTGATSPGNIIYTDFPRGHSSPPTPNTVPCMSLGGMARDTHAMSPPLAFHCAPISPCQLCTPVSNYQCPYQQYSPTAELPGSPIASLSAELDVSSTPTRFAFDREEDHHLSYTPPDLIPSSTADTVDEGGTSFSFDPSPVRETSRDGKYLSQMSYEELMEILPDLSAEQIKQYWQPAIQQKLPRTKRKQGELPTDPGIRAGRLEGETETFTKDDVNQIRSEYEIRLNTKDNEISGLSQLQDARMNLLCGFITSYFDLKSHESEDPSLQALKDLVFEQEERSSEPLHGDKLHILQCRQIEERQNYIAELESAATRNEKKVRAYKRENKCLKQELRTLKEDENRMTEELAEKDTQIATLNDKVMQLLTMRPATYGHSVPQTIEKDLPSPGPREWGRSQEPKQHMAPRQSISVDTMATWNPFESNKSLEAETGQGPVYSYSLD